MRTVNTVMMGKGCFVLTGATGGCGIAAMVITVHSHEVYFWASFNMREESSAWERLSQAPVPCPVHQWSGSPFGESSFGLSVFCYPPPSLSL